MTTFFTPGVPIPPGVPFHHFCEVSVLLKAPVSMPAGWLEQFGYHGGRQFVSLYWEPCGDEACYDDGISSACGMSDNWLFLAFIRKPKLANWLHENDIRPGDSEREAQHWLVVDAHTGDLYAAGRREAVSILLDQRLPDVA